MACDKALLVQAYVDGELDPGAALGIEDHLATCADCRSLAAATGQLRDALRALPPHLSAPAGLKPRLLRSLDRIDAEAGKRVGWFAQLGRFVVARRQWFVGAASGAAFAAAVAVAVVLLLPSDEDDRLLDGLLTAHVRSLMADHLIDVASSDRRMVQPWFDGHVDVAPPVLDLSAQGFALVGGRADFIDGKRVAVVVYRRGAHVINLFVWADYEQRPSGIAERSGFHFVMWNQGNLTFCAVSDSTVGDLETLAKLEGGETDTRAN